MLIAIIGGGFAGAACAFHLLRDHPDLHANVTMIEPREKLGAGLAYSSPAAEHRTNVAASRMSLLPEAPLHFHEWLIAAGDPARDPASAMADGRLYPARAVFGQYVAEHLAEQAANRPGVVFHHVKAMATHMEPAGRGFLIGIAGGTPISADAVVLAASHSAPDVPAVLRCCTALLPDPWDVAALDRVPADARVLVVGTGLTACDVVARLLARGHRGAVTMLSRNGLLPRPRTLLPVEAEGDFTTAPETTALALLRRVRRAMAVAVAGGRPWENIIDALRQQAGAAWGSLDWRQRKILLRHLRTWWDVHRFQCAPQIDAAIGAAQTSGAVRVRAARLLSVTEGPRGVSVTVRPRGLGADATIEADVVVACTGPGHRSVTASHPVLRGLAGSGDLLADPAALGIWVDADSRVRREDGTVWPNLFVAGPLARGTFGELMGLPQVNLQPRAVAAALAEMAAA